MRSPIGDDNLVLNENGSWALTVPNTNDVDDGDYEVVATVTDEAGNIATSAGTLTVDTVNPATPSITTRYSTTNTPIISIDAAAATGETFTVTVNDTTYSQDDDNLALNSESIWELTILEGSELPDGDYPITATVTDEAGNVTTSTSTLSVDTVLPATPSVTTRYSTTNTPIIFADATVATGETFTVTVNDTTYSQDDDNLELNSEGIWELTISIDDPLPDGNYEVIATVTDEAGNVASSTSTLGVDTVLPATPLITTRYSTSNTPIISGNATVVTGETLTVVVNEVTYTQGDDNLVLNENGSWALTVPNTNDVDDGDYPITASVTDEAGNLATSTSTLTVDTVLPATPSITTRYSTTNTPIIFIDATVATGETLTVSVNDTTYSQDDDNLSLNSEGIWELTIQGGGELPDGDYDVVATIIDEAGNIGTSTSTLGVDTVLPATPSITTRYSTNNTPIISIDATVATGETFTVTVNDTTYSQDDDNLALNSEGIWELTIPEGSELQDGDYPVTATVTDEAGNVGTSTSTLSVDTVVPATPLITTQTSNIDTPIISGIAPVAPDEILTVEINGITYSDGDSNLALNTDGNWTLTIPEFNALADDSYDVIASISDPAGNTTIAISRNALTVDTTPPVAPGITSMTTSDNTPVISGTAFLATGETLTVEVNGVTYIQGDGNLIVDTDDTWALTIPDADAFIDGTYQVVAIITDAAGNTSSDPGTSEIQVDTDAPNIPGITSLQSNDTTPAIKGMATLASGESLSVEINGVTYAQGDGNLTIDPDGAWTLVVPTALAEGAYDIKATITDPAGNTGTSTSTGGLLIDVTAPTAPSVRPLTTADSTPSLTGVADLASGDTLSVEVNGVTYTEENSDLIVNTDGTWSVTIPANDALPDGNYSVTTTVTDASGNSAVADNALGIDTIAPTTPSISSLISSTDTPVISGIATVAQDETLTVTVNGVTYTQGDGTLVLDDNGNWELTIPVDDALGDGSYDVTATVTDAAGNTTSDIVTNGLSVDTVAPATPSSTAQISNTDTPVVSGVAIVVSGETLTVTVNGVTYTQGDGDLVLNDNGNWELTIPDDNNLNDGNYNVVVIITDPAGNFATETNTLVVDTVAPATPTSIVQISNTDTPIISGTATDVSDGTLVVTINGVTYTEADANLVLNSNGNWNLTIPQNDALPDGIYNVTAAVTDAAGNTTIAVSENALTVDTTPPVVPGITSMTTSDNTPFIEGTVFLTAGETLTVEINGVTYTQTDGNIIVNSDGNWTLTIPASDALADGRYQIVATATDGAGNSSTDSSINELLIDTIAPSAPTVEPLATTDTTPTLTGIAVLTPGDLLSVEVGGITYFQGDGNLIVNPNSTWALTISATNALTEGNYPVTVTITDTAGNSSGAVSPTELIIQPADDFDNDGIFDVVDLDDDNDGIPDTIEGTRDTDGDGHPDSRDLDSDNDGVYDIIEAGGDDTDNDGKVDNFRESDANGLSDDLQIAPFDLVDTDRDRIPDFRDLDSDNDGIPDVIESGGVDDNNNGRIDNFTDANGDGADDVSQMRSTAERDSDGDGVPNRLDLDSNNDGLSDSFEAGSADSRGDGIIDTMLDSDSDGIPDSVDVSQTAGEDTDNDGIDDRFDASFLLEDDLDGDGIVDSADPDADGDGLADDPQNALALGQALPDNNGNGEFDGFDVDEGALRVGLSGRGGCSISPTPNNGSVDPLFALMLSVVATLLWRKRLIRIRRIRMQQRRILA